MSARPVFVVGSPRSGTSVTTWALGQHSNLLPLEETVWIPRLATEVAVAHRIGSERGPRSHLSASGIGRDEMGAVIGDALAELIVRHREVADDGSGHDAFRLTRSASDPKTRFVDGTPENSFWIAALLLLFPDARFVHLVRDVNDVVRSLGRFSNTGADDKTVEFGYRKWLRCASAVAAAEEAFGPEVVHRVRYADLVADPPRELATILEFCGEEWEPVCAEPFLVRINSSQVTERDPIDANGVSEDLVEAATSLSHRLLAEPQPAAPDPDARLRVDAELAARIETVASWEQDRRALRESLMSARGQAQRAGLEHVEAVLRGVIVAPGPVAVVSKGDDSLLDVVRGIGRTARHCPADPSGEWSGFHPGTTDEALDAVGALAIDGVSYLVIPWSTGWWLNHYEGLRSTLAERYRLVWRDERCTIFDLQARVPARTT